MLKKATSILLVMLLSVSLFAGCKKSPSTASSDTDSGIINVDNSTDDSQDSTQSGDQSGDQPGTPSGDQPGTPSGDQPSTQPGNQPGTQPGTSNGEFSLKGKTITYACSFSPTTNVKKMLNAFKKQYGIKEIKVDVLGFSEYVNAVTMAAAGNKFYDIIQLEGNRFPEMPLSNLVLPLDGVVKDSDFKSGLDKTLTENLRFNGKLYGVVAPIGKGEYGGALMVLYYNKVMFEKAGCDDPRELYDKGKWDWDALEEAGRKIRKAYPKAYLTDYETLSRMPIWNGASLITGSGGTVKALKTDAYVTALTKMQSFIRGNNAIATYTTGGSGYAGTATALVKGNIAMCIGAPFDLYENQCLGEKVSSASTFNKNIKNLGVIMPPCGPNNKKNNYPTYASIYGIAAGIGTQDARIAVEFAKFASNYGVTNTSKYTWSANDQKMFDSVIASGKVVFNGTANYSDGDEDTINLTGIVRNMVAQGKDINNTLDTYIPKIQKCIDVTLARK